MTASGTYTQRNRCSLAGLLYPHCKVVSLSQRGRETKTRSPRDSHTMTNVKTDITTYKLRDRYAQRFRHRSKRVKTHNDTQRHRDTEVTREILVKTRVQDTKDRELETQRHTHMLTCRH